MDGGVSDWDPGYWLDEIWFMGSFLTKMRPFTVTPSHGAFLLTTHAGTNIIQLPWRSDLPTSYNHVRLSTVFRADDSDVMAALDVGASMGTSLDLCIGGRMADSFTVASGATLKLNRPRAAGTVTGVSEVTYPSYVYLDGALDATAATWNDAQTLTANKAGIITVYYLPLFRVAITNRPSNFQLHNLMEVVIGFTEVIGY